MAGFTATIPRRPADAPGDTYPSEPMSDWNAYLRRAARTRYPGWNGTFAIRDATTEVSEVILAESGAEPSAWTPVEKTVTTVAGVKVDYTKFRREYATVTLRRYRKVTIRFRIHYHFMPATSRYDQDWEETWYTPIGDPWTIGPAVESRTKLTSWGGAISVGVGGTIGVGVEIEVGAEADFGHEGEDLTPPSEHPTPRTGGLERKDPPPDESLDGARPASDVERLRVAHMLQPQDREPLSAAEWQAAKELNVLQLAGVNLQTIAASLAEGRYPGLVRYLIEQGGPGGRLREVGLPWADTLRPGVILEMHDPEENRPEQKRRR